MTPIEITILKQALGAILDEEPLIYPIAFAGRYEKRTDFMEGWNQGVAASVKLTNDILTDLGIDIIDGDNCIDEPKIIIY